MSLYEDWLKKAYTKDGKSDKKVWDKYVPQEQKIYEHILGEKITEIRGTVDELAQRYDMTPEYVCGFIDGINEAVLEPIDIKELTNDKEIVLKVEFEKLYKKMVEFKAEHLYSLPEWDDIFTEDERKEMFWEQKKSGTVVKEPKIGRNEPCPCGSGKKYKKCCALVEENQVEENQVEGNQ